MIPLSIGVSIGVLRSIKTNKSDNMDKQISKTQTEKSFKKIGKRTISLIGEEAKKLNNKLQTFEKNFEDPENKEIYFDLLNKTSISFELVNHTILGIAAGKEYEALVKDFCEQIIKEFHCDTPSQRALAEILSGSYIRWLRLSNLLKNVEEYIKEHAYIATICKEIDRSQRTYISSLFSLRQLKSPTIALNVKATTAFIAENQQVNANQTIEKGEINNAK